ncbi:polysaccharide deacetylase family protein [Actimicrobium sp. CCI2.3]|uniref:polysaccharide deacetylase family protein n=1 Tax=Actimicrobium sp. CCI2.3 TaxID=3048616 RepID=UPI002AB38B56|nr:polysaccharide deacetylase family protein [Actimicrobium sp. CCI2.3]MDY7574389.1 polysaccharide deacetylase family protein [Actimicrobium sp. CCI2.3]MEB0022532.1 polysaccharide deacetylase family protein [Actimicrobium sp. CCI2.3]
MSLPDTYLEYPQRHYGMDHTRYDWSTLPTRKPVVWPNGARVALWVIPALEWFPLDMKSVPFKPPGAMMTAYPDLRHYTLRDYGNRVGIFRVMQALDRHGIRASVAINAAVAARYPALLHECTQRGWEIIASGQDMDHLHHAGLGIEDERKLIDSTLALLRNASGQAIRGWLSPAKSESAATLDLLGEAGMDYVCDWVNDDMPYPLHTANGALHAMPHPIDMDDHTILVQNHHSEDDFRDQLCDQFDYLYRESATQGGRVMAISLHPWVIGQPYRIKALEEALAHIMQHDGVWAATGSEILDAWKEAQA